MRDERAIRFWRHNRNRSFPTERYVHDQVSRFQLKKLVKSDFNRLELPLEKYALAVAANTGGEKPSCRFWHSTRRGLDELAKRAYLPLIALTVRETLLAGEEFLRKPAHEC